VTEESLHSGRTRFLEIEDCSVFSCVFSSSSLQSGKEMSSGSEIRVCRPSQTGTRRISKVYLGILLSSSFCFYSVVNRRHYTAVVVSLLSSFIVR